MEDQKKCKVLIVEADADLRTRIENLLLSGKYLVTCFESSLSAFTELENSRSKPYAVAIVSYKMPGMKGDEVLKKIRELSPGTQRILITDALSIDVIIKAINNVEITSCLSFPFRDSDLTGQVQYACRQFLAIQKQHNLIRVTQRQNKQLYRIAKQLKEKKERNINRIEELKNRIRVMKSRLHYDADLLERFSLKDIIKEKGISISPEGLLKEYLTLKEQIKEILERAAEKSIGVALSDSGQVKESKFDKNKYTKVMEQIQSLSFLLLKKTAFLGVDALEAVLKNPVDNSKVEIILSSDKIRACIKLKTSRKKGLNLMTIRDLLEKNSIRVGIKDDDYIKSWLIKADKSDDPVLIARGREPLQPRNAEIIYHFPIDFRRPGKVDSRGRIDFKDRGEIPFVKKNIFLAEKIFPKKGVAGMDVTGEIIPVPEPEDMAFGAGPGARISDDGSRIYADVDGQPGLDPLGNVSVSPELNIKGDVDYRTGNIEFNGNVVITGIVKEGFSVKGASLTAEQVEGARIELTGDLNVSSGIVDTSLVKVQGNIQAQYVNNSNIYGFGDLIVQKEIIDSKIRLSGACINTGGRIIASDMSAKMGIDAGDIGTDVSKPSKLTVGIDEQTDYFIAEIDLKLKENIDMLVVLKDKISILNEEDQSLHMIISEHAYTQDRTQLKLKDVEKKKLDLQTLGNKAGLEKIVELEKKMIKQAEHAENEINKGFKRQDAIAREISGKKEEISIIEQHNQELVREKRKLQEFTAKKESRPVVRVLKGIMGGTRVDGPNSFIIINNPCSRCKIMEIKRQDTDSMLSFYEMVVSDLRT